MLMSKQISALLSQVVAKAVHEPEFRSQLLTHPKRTLSHLAIPIPDEQNVTVLESKEGQIFFVLPILSDDDVKQLSASLSSVHPQRSIRSRVLIKAAQDSDYKAQLVRDPKAVLNAEGMMIPESAELAVLENSDRQLYIVLPQIHTHKH
jgi:hypothetical protein